MSEETLFALGLTELQRVQALAEELHAGCCQPLRSPRMEALSDTLQAAYTALEELEGDAANAQDVVDLLEDAGSQLGHLQVACCSPARTKLYTESLERLGRAQRLIRRTLDMEH